MLRNYLLLALRNLKKHLAYSFINIFGLGLGLATCLLLVIWISHELSYDRFNEKASRIYRISLEYGFGGQVARTAVSPTALLPAILSLPEAETGVRTYNPSAWSPYIVKRGEKLFQEQKFYAADSTFFDVFSYKLIQGNKKMALNKPYQVILTKAMAEKYFDGEDAMGKTLLVNGTQEYIITGIIENPPSNSLMQFDFICSFQSLRAGREDPMWWSANYQTFVVVNPNTDVKAMEEKTSAIAKQAVASELTGPGDYVKYNFLPLTDIYLRSDVNGEPEAVGSIRYVYIFSAVAVLILLMACINYVNLSTARAADRAKEVGIRKVVGAVKKQLFFQFIGESFVITFLSFVLAFFLSQIFLPVFNDLTGKQFNTALFLQPSFLMLSAFALVIIALLAGAYPAFAITSFKPVSVLKGNFKSSGKGIWLRKSLVVFQFSISIILIAGTLIISKQMHYIQSKDLGYDQDNTIMVPLDDQTQAVYESFKNELLRNGVAKHVGRGTESPVNVRAGYSINKAESNEPGIITTGLVVDEAYLPSIDVKPFIGRTFTKEDVDRVNRDTVYTFILNESAVSTLMLKPEDAIGKRVAMGDRKGEIIGVVKDFHFAPLHQNIGPLTIFTEESQYSKILINMPKGNVSDNLKQIENVYASLISHRPFEFQFLDQQYGALYTNEQRLSSVFTIFAVLAVVIGCLGLVGLVSFSASQKTKEIGIRKVLGASASSIVVLITKDFSKLVLVAIFIGLPVAYWLMEKWLSDFAYKTDLGFIPFIIAAVVCIVIAFASAGYHAIKAALLDPAKTIRNE